MSDPIPREVWERGQETDRQRSAADVERARAEVATAAAIGELADEGPEAGRSFLVELPAVPAWSLDPDRFRRLDSKVFLVSVGDSPDLLRRAADTLVERIPGAERRELDSTGPGASVEALSLLVSNPDGA
jgi:hypothetical protein